MTDIVKVEGWILDYACFHREFDVLNAICKRYPDITNIAEHLNVPLIRYTTAFIHHVVDKSKFESFAFIIELLDDVYQLLMENIPFQDYVRLSSGLKMQTLVRYLLKGETVLAIAKLNQYFPRTGMKNSRATSKELNRLNRMISSFRKFYLPLLANENQRKFYLEQEYPEEYGPRYTESLKKITYKFINIAEEYMPIPAIQKILNVGAATLSSIPINLSPVPYEILLEYCMNNTSLSCADMLDILTSISPLHTQDRVELISAQESDASDSVAVQSILIESLFEEETCAVHPINTEQMSSTASPDYTRLRNSKVETNTTTDEIMNNKRLINENEKNGCTTDSSLQSNSVARVNGHFPITKSRNATELIRKKSDINSINPAKKIKLSNAELDKLAMEDFQHLKRNEPANDTDSYRNVNDKQIPNHVSPIMIVKSPLSKVVQDDDVQDLPELIKCLNIGDLVVVDSVVTKVLDLSKKTSSCLAITDEPQILGALVRCITSVNRKISRCAAETIFNLSCHRPGLLAILKSDDVISTLVKKLSILSPRRRKKNTKQHIRNSSVEPTLFYIIRTLHNILLHQENSIAIVQIMGCLQKMVALLQSYNDVEFLDIITDCLRILACDNQESRRIILASRGPKEVVYLLKSHTNEKLLWTTSEVLKFLCQCERNKTAIIEAGGIQALNMHLDHKSTRLVQNCVLILRNLFDDARQVDVQEVTEEGLLPRDASQEEASGCQETCIGDQSSVFDKTTILSGNDESHIIHSSIVNEDLEMSNEGVLQDLSACIIKNRKCQCQNLCVIKLVRNKEIDELDVQKDPCVSAPG